MCESALDLIERQPGIGSPVFGKMLGIPDLRSWKVANFPVLWFYFEGDDHVDVIRLLGERQDIATVLTNCPDWRPMPSVGLGVREIRVRTEAGAFRVIYFTKLADWFVSCTASKRRPRKQVRRI